MGRADGVARSQPRTPRPSGPSSAGPVLTTSATAASSASPTSGRASRIGSVISTRSPGTRRSSARARRRARPSPRSREARGPCRRWECGARRPCSGAAEDELTGASGQPLDPLREVVDRHRRARVSDVEALADRVRMLEREQQRLDHVVDVAPGADLRAVAVDDEVVAGERRLDEGADGAAADLPGAVDVERTDRDRRAARARRGTRAPCARRPASTRRTSSAPRRPTPASSRAPRRP